MHDLFFEITFTTKKARALQLFAEEYNGFYLISIVERIGEKCRRFNLIR